MKFKKLMTSLLVGTLAIGVVGCSNNKSENKVNSMTDGKTLKVVSAYGGQEEIFKKFTKDTGVKVEFIDMSSGEVLSRIKAENGKPIADLWFGGGADSFIAAKEADLLQPYISKESKNIPKEYKDKEGYWTGVSLVTVGFMVNNEIIKEKGLDIPRNWDDLTNEKLKSEVMIADPSISGTNYAMVSGLIQTWGEYKAWKYFENLNRNISFFAKRGSEPANKVQAGEFGVGIIPVSKDSFEAQKQYPVTIVYPEDILPWVPAPVAIFKNAENAESAKVFIDWALSKDGQEFIQTQDPRIMTRPDVKEPEGVGRIPTDRFVKLDVEKLGLNRDEILGKWNEQFGNESSKQ
ncbi:ABC transporter substrate-binding protein [Paraclostridium benzoelyticum]|uniref:ABC transporter substrate-binding protein n=1 Tax=Paraclostridium benzoelyticum TaxID=1629550 RepID=A0A0M3DHB2_9FIRM|nr:ABC transporter substrate-binding protein [Paraclostridium benzoelyticum]KKY00839.1 ABC transporter substrate-binding protein [Paraclostridium benzoelyticum]